MRQTKVPAFYTNKSIEAFAAKPSTPISLKHLVNFGKVGRNKGEKEETEKLLKGGNFLRTELPIRLSHRLRDLQQLPFVVASNPHIANVYDLYLEAFEEPSLHATLRLIRLHSATSSILHSNPLRIRKFPTLQSLEDNDRFCTFIQEKLDKHRVVIPELAIGVSEVSPFHLPPQDLDTFMLRMLRSRISRRVITEQHVALTQQFREHRDALALGRGRYHNWADHRHVGIVDTSLNVAEVVEYVREFIAGRGGPEAKVPVNIEGELDTRFAYIGEHLEFMLYELLRGAVGATVARHGPEAASGLPVTVTINHQPREMSVRVSDQGGGLSPYGGLPPPPSPLIAGAPVSHVETAQRLDIFSFSHMRRAYQQQTPTHDLSSLPSNASSDVVAPTDSTTVTGINALRNVSKLSGTLRDQPDYGKMQSTTRALDSRQADEEQFDAIVNSGIGLPLARMYAEYFAGSLQIYTIQGHGSDALLRVPKFGAEAHRTN
ncbi:putative protein kinase [Microbotryomycetes sp. JL201]|nr:putative protein kinase [Microbotryomycetes sp. JL201]